MTSRTSARSGLRITISSGGCGRTCGLSRSGLRNLLQLKHRAQRSESHLQLVVPRRSGGEELEGQSRGEEHAHRGEIPVPRADADDFIGKPRDDGKERDAEEVLAEQLRPCG